MTETTGDLATRELTDDERKLLTAFSLLELVSIREAVAARIEQLLKHAEGVALTLALLTTQWESQYDTTAGDDVFALIEEVRTWFTENLTPEGEALIAARYEKHHATVTARASTGSGSETGH